MMMAHPVPPKNRSGFEIAIICATKVEADAVEASFDKVWDQKYLRAPGDTNAYTTGVIGDHNTVLAYMPCIGKGAAGKVAGSFCSSFTGIRLALLVGICGGVPSGGADTRKELLLGDVVISNGIVQYDLGRRLPGKFKRKNTLNDNLGRPNMEILKYLEKLQGWMGAKTLKDRMTKYLKALLEEADFEESRYPGPDRDLLFEPAYHHKHHKSEGCLPCTDCDQGEDSICDNALHASCSVLGCDETKLIHRTRLNKAKEAMESPKPAIHYGKIASGDTVMRSGEDRDEISRSEGVIAFEMEGAGVWDSFPCVIIKGICDYADSHKSKEWQAYAAATAASCMKSFLEDWSSWSTKNNTQGRSMTST
jgi:nucleoside phosphorylase